jgi:hypothetical protein
MKHIIIGTLIILALAAGGYYWYNNKQNEQAATQTDTSTTTMTTMDNTDAEATNTGNSESLAALLQSGENQTCTYEYSNNGNTISGAVYLSGDKMRNNYEMTGTDQNMTGSMIRDGDTMYVWGSSTPQGIKMQFDMDKLQEQMQNMAPVDVNAQTQYNCESWNVDENMFVPPSDVTFNDMSAMMNSMPAMTNPEDACKVCDSLTGDNKTACLQEFNCQ